MRAAEARVAATVITCGGCGVTWTTRAAAHCAGCHHTFDDVPLFDRHRSGAGPHGRCTLPDEHRDTRAAVAFDAAGQRGAA